MSTPSIWSRRGILATVIAATMALTACTSSVQPQTNNSGAPSEDADSNDVTVGLTYIPNVQFAPTYLAEDNQFFQAEGVNATIRHHGADEGLFTQLLAGKENLVVATGDEMIQARSQGMDLVSVGQYYASYPVVVIVKDESDIKTIADLKGKKVGLPGEFGSNWYGLLAALKDAQMETSDIEVMAIGYTQMAALQTDQVDAIVGFVNNDAVQLEQAGIKARQIPLTTANKTPLVGATIVTTGEYARTHPQQVRAALAAIQKGMQAFVDDTDAAVKATEKRDPSLSTDQARQAAKATADATAKLIAPNGTADVTQDLQLWEEMDKFLTTVPGLMGAPVKLDETVTNEYLK
ncbi:MAG: ABC transporter substrate-binding protein [Actinomycetaceae bacterium]|nr:ABC transporter substrate-binding protein [Actinomycetaceae bacterium]